MNVAAPLLVSVRISRVFILQSADFTNQAHSGRIAGPKSSIAEPEPKGAQLLALAELDPTKNHWDTKVKNEMTTF